MRIFDVDGNELGSGGSNELRLFSLDGREIDPAEADLVAPVAKVKGKKVMPKKPAKPTLDKLKKQAAAFETPFAQTQAQEGYEFQVEGAPSQVELKVKPLTDLDYKKPMFELGQTKAEAPKLKPIKARRRLDESAEDFTLREAQFEDYKKKSKIAEQQQRAEVIRKTAPKLGLEKYPIAMAEGVSNVLRPIASAAEQASGTGTDYFAYYNQMPKIGQQEADEWGVKVAEGLGSTIPFGIASALGGMPATVIIGAASNSASTYEDAKMRGASDEAALAAAVPGAVIGSLEGLFGLGTGRFMKEIGKGGIKTLFGGVAEEELQELTSQALNNVNAKWLSGYDPQRALSEGLWETFTTTLGTAGLMHGAGAASGIAARLSDPKLKADEALRALPEPDRKAVQFASLSPDLNSFKALTPKQRQAALLNWHMEAHPVFRDETGNPKIFYHGTKVGEIDFFDTQSDSNIGSHFGSKRAANSFADSKEEEGTVVYPVYLNIKNPAITSDRYPIGIGPESLKAALQDVKTLEGDSIFSKEEIDDWVGKMRTSDFMVQMAGDKIFKAALEAKGFDGIQYKNEIEDPGHISTIAFYPHQVKSAWAREFDPGSAKLELSELEKTPKGWGTAESRFKFTQPAARFYEGRGENGGTLYINPQMAKKMFGDSAEYSSAGGINIETSNFGKGLRHLDPKDPQTKVLEKAFAEAIQKNLPSINIVNYSEGQGMWARRIARHESFHRGQYLASREALKAKGQEGLFQPDIGTIHDPAMHDHPVVQRVANSPIGESIKSRYEESYAPAALTFETAAYMASNDFRRFGVTADEAATFVADYLESVANKSGVKGLQALVDGTRLIPSIEQKAKEIISGRTEQTIGIGRGSADVSGRLGGTVDEFAESGLVGGGDKGDGGGGVSEAIGPEPPNIYTTVLSSDAVKQIAKKAGDVLKVLGIPENPLLPPHEQIMRALKDHPDKATPEAIGAAMRQLGLDGKDLVEAVDEASKHAGQLLRNLQDANAKWTKTIKDDPKWATEAAKTGAHILGLGPSPKEVLKEGLASLEASELGRTWWQRSGDLYRKMLLSRFSTAAVNSITTTVRLPLDLIDGAATGAAMGALNPKKYAGKSDATIAEAAKEGAIAGAQATMRVAMAFPEMAKKLLRKPTPEMDTNDLIISQMENLHPELHTKLTGLSTGLDVIKESKAKIEDLKSLLPYLNDSEKQKEYEAKLNILQKRYDQNNSMLGKMFNKTGWVYDQFIKPSTVQEFFFRRPYFVGALVKRAKDAGYDLYNLIENTKRIEDFSKDPTGQDVNEVLNLQTLANLPPEVWEGAADDALTFTYAYAPKKDRGVVENLYATWIQSMQKLGLAGAIIDAFPKATYNGLKFAYEYSPLGMLKPTLNIAGDVRAGGREAVKSNDVSRMVKGGLGMAMFATALYIRKEHGGEEWYQIKTSRKDKKGQPIYMNVKKYMPFAGMLYLADVANRAWEGRLFEAKTHADDMAELYLNARRADSGGAAFFDLTKEMMDWMDTGAPLKDKTKAAAARPLANVLGAPLTPLVNLRDMVAQFDEDEAARRDQKGAPILGPAIDKIPWLRSSEKYGLPLTQPPTEQAPRPFSAAPGLTWFGVNLDPGSNFATREFARLGLSPIRWLRPHPDPTINKAQYAAYAEILSELGPAIEADINYQQASDKEKAAYLEALLSGADGFAGVAKQIGEQANPQYVEMEKLRQTQKPLMRKSTGLDKAIQEMKNASDKK
ncbi:MAG: hypothetical protein E6R03_08405 [Hyphomicrobiaceae bacterium]|nr:MAG: hypothetical protein E6R03_08405 [Hyphomicrobiaceae bacterium]